MRNPLKHLFPKILLPSLLLVSIITALIGFGIPLYKRQPSVSDLKRISHRIHDTLLPLYTKSQDFKRTAIFLYTPDYSERVFLYSHHVTVDPSIETYPTFGDPAFEDALQFHKADLCYVVNSTRLTKDSLMHIVIDQWEDIDIETSVYYLSCPIYIDGVLAGYVGSVIDLEEKGHGLIEDVLLIQLLADKVEDELESLF